MSQENVEIVRRVSDAYNRCDVGAMLDELHPEVEWHPWLQIQFGGGATVYRGHEGVRKGIREVEDAFSEIQAEQTEIRDLGDRVVAIRRLQDSHSSSRFRAVLEPPLLTGMMWSYSSRIGDRHLVHMP